MTGFQSNVTIRAWDASTTNDWAIGEFGSCLDFPQWWWLLKSLKRVW